MSAVQGDTSPKTAGLSRRTRYGVLLLLLLVYTSNFIDRTIVGIIAQPMKEDLALSDAQLGLLGGLAFAIFYTTLGLPIAQLAERRSRVGIISISVFLWSVCTALCGLVTSFGQLLVARIGVGVGEAGCTPPAQSLISDLFPPERRAWALSIYGLGIPAGVLFGALLGGWIATAFSWRHAFILVGAPGVLLALLTAILIREPRRGQFDPPAKTEATPAFGDVLRHLLRTPALRQLIAGAALASFGGFSVQAFAVPFLLRRFDLSLAEASTGYGVLAGLAAVGGTLLGGVVSDRLGKRQIAMLALVPAAGLAISAPLYTAVFLQQELGVVVLLAALPTLTQYVYLGPTYALVNNLTEPRMRARAVAVLLLAMNLIGLGLGPLVTGLGSDLAAGLVYGSGFATECQGSSQGAACRTASSEGLGYALAAACLSFLWAGYHYRRAGRALRGGAGRALRGGSATA